MQTLALYIQKHHFRGIDLDVGEPNCCQLADDTTIFLKKWRKVKKALDSLNVFLRINVKKFDLFPLKNKPLDLNKICEIPVKEVIAYLGIKIVKNQEERAKLHFIPLMEQMDKKFDSWLNWTRSLTIWTGFVVKSWRLMAARLWMLLKPWLSKLILSCSGWTRYRASLCYLFWTEMELFVRDSAFLWIWRTFFCMLKEALMEKDFFVKHFHFIWKMSYT